MTKKAILLKLPNELYEQVQKASELDRRNVSQWIRLALERQSEMEVRQYELAMQHRKAQMG